MNLKMLLFASVSLVLFASCHNSDEPYMPCFFRNNVVQVEDRIELVTVLIPFYTVYVIGSAGSRSRPLAHSVGAGRILAGGSP